MTHDEIRLLETQMIDPGYNPDHDRPLLMFGAGDMSRFAAPLERRRNYLLQEAAIRPHQQRAGYRPPTNALSRSRQVNRRRGRR